MTVQEQPSKNEYIYTEFYDYVCQPKIKGENGYVYYKSIISKLFQTLECDEFVSPRM